MKHDNNKTMNNKTRIIMRKSRIRGKTHDANKEETKNTDSNNDNKKNILNTIYLILEQVG